DSSYLGLRKKYRLSLKNDMLPQDKNVHKKFYKRSNDHEEIETGEDDDPGDIAEIFKIEDNLFDHETPLCKSFNEFNYLLKINTKLFTFEIQEIKTYEEYELNNNMTGETEEPCKTGRMLVDEKAPFARSENQGQGPFTNTKTKKDYDIYLDSNHITVGDYRSNNADNIQDNMKEYYNPSICKIRRFKMMKYSFNADDEYVSIREHEHSITDIDACQAYRQLFRTMNKGCTARFKQLMLLALNAVATAKLKEFCCSAQCLIEDEDFVKRLRRLFGHHQIGEDSWDLLI
nr:hypothetical protein [Tanacetum cinerariifolium]